MADSEFKLRRGIHDVYAAEVTVDNEDNYTVGDIFHLIPVGTLSRSVSSDKTDTYFDDHVFATVGSEGATALTFEGASLRQGQIARILGKDIDPTTGAVLDSGDYVEKYFAVVGVAEGLDGSDEWFSFLKGSFTAPEIDDTTKDDSTNANGMTVNYSAIKTVHKFGGKRRKAVTADSTTSQLKTGKTWSAQIVTPDNVAEIIQAAVAQTGITVTPTTATVEVGSSTTLTAALVPATAIGTVSWSTSDGSKAIVSGGVVTGVAAGSAVITASCNGFSASCTVTVSG